MDIACDFARLADQVPPVDAIGDIIEAGAAASVNPAAPWYPAWAPWVLWIVVVALITVALAEIPKRVALKKSQEWGRAKKAEKVRMMAPWLAFIGAGMGAGIFSAAPGIQLSAVLGAALGAGVGVVSFSIYDVIFSLIGLIPRFVKKKAGLDTDTVDAISDTSSERRGVEDPGRPPEGGEG